MSRQDESPSPSPVDNGETARINREGSAAAQAPDLDVLADVDVDDTDQPQSALQALFDSHGDRFDPVRVRYIQALAEQAGRQRPAVAEILARKALRALTRYRDDFSAARRRAETRLQQVVTEQPDREEALRKAFARGDFNVIERMAAIQVDRSGHAMSLASLVQALAGKDTDEEPRQSGSLAAAMREQDRQLVGQHGRQFAVRAANTADSAGSGAMRRFRQSLRAHHEQQRIERELRDGRDDRGPLNSQTLVVRSLEMMQEISPGYTQRFVSYMDTLLWLQRAAASLDGKKKPQPKRRRRR